MILIISWSKIGNFFELTMRHCCIEGNVELFLLWQILLPSIVMLLLIAVRTRVDTQIHPAQP